MSNFAFLSELSDEGSIRLNGTRRWARWTIADAKAQTDKEL